MTHPNEIDTFRATWEREAQKAIRLMEALPADQYDFRPDPKGRSIGEMAWHLSEIDGCISYGVVERRFDLEDTLPELVRPKEVKLLAPGYRRVHELAIERLQKVRNEELDERVTFFDGTPMTIRDVLWNVLLHHHIHHRAQLVLLCRISGGRPPGLYGPNREEMQAIVEKMKAGKA
ncbi:MAG TPA: DinB family protein [Candidatus Eisenbacteria bacterium]|jgi:uncharacterized damage-inducible protein DinB|nr:DinB family protein [Candidatus Eisenbacteria bacterium]